MLGNPVSIKTFSTNTTVVEIIALVLFIIQIEFNRQYFKHSKSLLHFKVMRKTKFRNDQHLFWTRACHEKSCLRSFQPGKTQACLQRLETLQGFELPILENKSDHTIWAVISMYAVWSVHLQAVTLICRFCRRGTLTGAGTCRTHRALLEFNECHKSHRILWLLVLWCPRSIISLLSVCEKLQKLTKNPYKYPDKISIYLSIP